MNIREADLKDCDALARLYTELTGREMPEDQIVAQAVIQESGHVYVLVDDGEVVGTGTLTFRSVPTAGRVGYVDDIVVSSACQGKGYGKQMIDFLIKTARQKGCVRLDLTSGPQRTNANMMYISTGFSRRRTNCYVYKL